MNITELNQPIVATVYAKTPEEAKEFFAVGNREGCDAFLFAGECFPKQFRTKEILTDLFSLKGDRLLIVTSYKDKESADWSDDDCVSYLNLMLSCGADVPDIPVNLYGDDIITCDALAVRKQAELAKSFHQEGRQVIFSCHSFQRFLSEEEIIVILTEEQNRGADILKVVNSCKTKEEIENHIKSYSMIKSRFSLPFLSLPIGVQPLENDALQVRLDGVKYGNCMSLCKTSENGFQPSIREQKNAN